MGIIEQVLPTVSPEPDADSFCFDAFRVFSTIPEHHHDVVPLLGLALVYDKDELFRQEIEDGALYVVEDQRPVGGMSWETYDRFNQDHTRAGQPRVRLHTNRRVVRVTKRRDGWWQVMPTGYHDGPFADWSVAQNMVGKVVGIYQPVNNRGQS